MASIREMMMGSWRGSGNAKSAGTHDMPIPGMVTSRRVRPAPKKTVPQAKPQPMKPVPVVKEKKLKSRKSPRRRRGGSSRSSSSASSPEDKSPRRQEPPGQHDQALEAFREAQKLAEANMEEEQRRRDLAEESERRRRKAQAEEWAKLQAERELKRQDDAKQAEERRQMQVARQQERKKKLSGAFAMAGDDLDDDGVGAGAKVLAAQQQKASSRLTLALHEPQASRSSKASVDGIAPMGQSATSDDAVALRASLADPSASRSFAPGEVAEKYKLLMEMKRKFRRSDFGGSAAQRSRSRSRDRSRRARSSSRNRYDSVWIRPK